MVKIKRLQDFTELSIKNAPEFIQENCIEDIIEPLEKHGWVFKGYGSMGNMKEECGIHVLIFDHPSEGWGKKSTPEIDEYVPKWEDEGSIGFHYVYFSTLYYCITMPF